MSRRRCAVVAVDTNILARFYVDDPTDPEAPKQRPLARALIERSDTVFVPITVVLELEWVMRGFYGKRPAEFCGLLDHLAGLRNVTIEALPRVLEAVGMHRDGMDFADAMHLAGSRQCEEFATFDARRFARRAARLNLKPRCRVPDQLQ